MVCGCRRDRRKTAYDSVRAASIIFSPDSKRIAYAARVTEYLEGIGASFLMEKKANIVRVCTNYSLARTVDILPIGMKAAHLALIMDVPMWMGNAPERDN